MLLCRGNGKRRGDPGIKTWLGVDKRASDKIVCFQGGTALDLRALAWLVSESFFGNMMFEENRKNERGTSCVIN